MAKNNAVKIRDLNPAGRRLPYGVFSRFDEYENLLANEIAIRRTDGQEISFVEEAFAKRALIERGGVGFDKITEKWYYVYGEGLNELGNPTTLVLVTANGRTLTREASYDGNPDGAYIIKAYPFGFVLASMIKETTDFMTNCDVAMRQNLEACKTPFVVVCKDDDLRLSFKQAVQQKELGQAAIIVSPELSEGLKAINITPQFLVSDFAEARDAERDLLLTKLGILTSNKDKRERIQSAEVNATLGQATDYIYLLIDTFNKQMKTYALPFEMVYNGSMEEIYLNDGEAETSPIETDVNDVEKGNKIND